MASSKEKQLWSSSRFQSRTTEDRKAYRKWNKEYCRILADKDVDAGEEWKRQNPPPK